MEASERVVEERRAGGGGPPAAPVSDRRPSLTVIVPALNEQENIGSTIRAVLQSLDGLFRDFEILVFNDGSTDETGARAEALARQHRGVRVVHNRRRMGIGFAFKRGVRLSRMDYCVMIPGDDETDHESITRIFREVGRADVVITYPGNPAIRPYHRRLVSRVFTTILNLVFNQRVPYYNGTNIYPRAILQQIPLDTYGPAYSASILVRMLRRGASSVSAPMHTKVRPSGRSKIFRWKNVLSVGLALLKLLREGESGSTRETARAAERAEDDGVPCVVREPAPGA
jgi:dolichol-phosphate mannosyltransferase